MTELTMKIWTEDECLFEELKELGTEGEVIAQGARLCFRRGERPESLGGGLPLVVEVALQLGTGVVASLVADWIFNKLRGRTRIVRIGGTAVSTTEESRDKTLKIISGRIRETASMGDAGQS